MQFTQTFVGKLRLKVVLARLFLAVLAWSLFSANAALADPNLILRSGSWELVSVPTQDASLTFRELTAGKLDVQAYQQDWSISTFNPQTGLYEQPNLDTPIARNQGFWIIQITGDDVIFDAADMSELPANPCQEFTSGRDAELATGCAVTMNSSTSDSIWTMVGLAQTQGFGSNSAGIRLESGSDCVAQGCSLAQAADIGLVSRLFVYNSSLKRYEDAETLGGLQPWQGAWFASPGSNGLTRLFLEPPGLEAQPATELPTVPYNAAEIASAGLDAKAADLPDGAQVRIAAVSQILDEIGVMASERLFGFQQADVVGGVSIIVAVPDSLSQYTNEVSLSVFGDSPIKLIISCSPDTNECKVAPTHRSESGETFFEPEAGQHFLAILR